MVRSCVSVYVAGPGRLCEVTASAPSTTFPISALALSLCNSLWNKWMQDLTNKLQNKKKSEDITITVLSPAGTGRDN